MMLYTWPCGASRRSTWTRGSAPPSPLSSRTRSERPRMTPPGATSIMPAYLRLGVTCAPAPLPVSDKAAPRILPAPLPSVLAPPVPVPSPPPPPPLLALSRAAAGALATRLPFLPEAPSMASSSSSAPPPAAATCNSISNAISPTRVCAWK